MRKVFWGIICLFLAGCMSSRATMEYSQPGMGMKTQTRHAAGFNAVRVEGPFDVDLHTGYRHPRIVVSADKTALPFIKTFVKYNTLWIQCPDQCARYGQAKLRINAGKLRAFYYQGAGRITGQALHASSLNLSIRNPKSTTLSGQLGLHQVKLSGGGATILSGVKTHDLQLKLKDRSKLQIAGWIRLASLQLGDGSWLSMYWIESKQLRLRGSGDTFIQLAGVADVLDVELWDTARFKGRYLRAKESFVKTHDHAVAEITTLNHQHTLATDASDIYFYKVPQAKADYMAFNGSVLDMHEWIQDGRYDPYTKYNK